jgi:hypothetical protein
MRTHLAIATALAISLPAIPAGAAARMPEQSAAAHGTPVLSRPGIVSVDTTAHGALTLEARQLQGAEAVSVAGTAPANAQITITLLATVSPDIPTILVSRHDVVADATGRFGAVIPIASAYERGVVLTLLATSAPGVSSASARLVTDAPNAGASVPLITH